MISAVLILPAALQEAGNAIAVALGHDVAPGSTYVVPLYAIGGDDTPTHFGSRASVTPAFQAIVEAAQNGEYPEGIDPAAAGAVIGALISSFRVLEAGERPAAHFDDVAASHGLERRAQELDA